jgi:nucleoside-diphosphate-sugar epimerase
VAPHQVYAPEDKLFLPAMLQTAISGKLRIFGKGENAVSFTHADNIAHGLVLAAAKLWQEGPESRAAGEFFVVTDTGARNFWDAVDMAIEECGLPSLRSRMHLSPNLLSLIAHLGSVYTQLTGRFVKLTPFTLRMLIINRTFCTAKARHLLGYKPVISFEDGWAETLSAAKAMHFTVRQDACAKISKKTD